MSPVRELAVWHIKGDLVRLRRGRVADHRLWVDEPPDEPDAGEAIHMRPRTRHPALVAIGRKRRGRHAHRRGLSGGKRVREPRKLRGDKAPLGGIKEIHPDDIRVPPLKFLERLLEPGALLRVQLRPKALLELVCLGFQARHSLQPVPGESAP